MCTALLMTLAIWAPALAAGTAEEVSYYSDALGMDKTALVYLPEGYETAGETYPVVYFVGGFGCGLGNWCSTPELVAELDSMIGDGLIDPFILVEVDQLVMPWPDLPVPMPSFLTDSELNGAYETLLVDDLVPWIDSAYRTRADRDHRYIFGRSAAGYSATRTALRHWDVFGGLGTQVGTIAIEPIAAAIPMILSEYPDGPPYEFNPAAGLWSMYLYSWCAALTPNMANPPWYVDLIIDADGNLDPAAWQRFSAHSNSRWAAEMAAAGGNLDIFMDAGDQDFYLPFTLYFAGVLASLDLPHTLQLYEGDHDNPPMWERLRSHFTYFMPLNATVELRPRMINARNWWIPIRASVELPGDLEATSIVVETLAITEIDSVALAVPIPAAGPPEITDLDGNGRNDLNITFDKGALVDNLVAMGITDNQPFTVTVEGETDLGWFLAATDSLRAVNLDHRGH
jgi:S-formylglutathione hydrolase FrmB